MDATSIYEGRKKTLQVPVRYLAENAWLWGYSFCIEHVCRNAYALGFALETFIIFDGTNTLLIMLLI